MILERSTNYASRSKIVGFETTKELLTADITDYYFPEEKKHDNEEQKMPYLAII